MFNINYGKDMKDLENQINQLLNVATKLQVGVKCKGVPSSKTKSGTQAIKNATAYLNKICNHLEVS